MSSVESPEKVHVDPRCNLGVLGPIVVSHWAAPPTEALATRLHNLLARLARTHEALGYVATIVATPSLPDAATRARLTAAVGDPAHRVRAAGIVIEGPPLAAATLRALLSGMNLLVQTPMPRRIFATDTALAAWMAGEVPGCPDPGVLCQAMSTVRAWR